MKRTFAGFCLFIIVGYGCTDKHISDDGSGGGGVLPAPEKVTLHGEFSEGFSDAESEWFDYNYRTSRDDFRYYPGVPSISERKTEVLMLRIDPADAAGAGRGPEVRTKDYTFYGSYSARIRVPDIRKAQPDAGIVVDFSVYDYEKNYGLCEAGFEWILADPEIVCLKACTGVEPERNTVMRTVNLAKGLVYDTSFRGECILKNGKTEILASGKLSGAQNFPETVTAISGYDASSKFHTYGFDWYPERIVWWILHPQTSERTVLWEYEGRELFPGSPAPDGIPVIPSRYHLNFWHSKIKPVQTNPSSTQSPYYPYELEADNMSYRPFDDLNQYYAAGQE